MIALVTGGAGFIGSNLVKKLLSEGVKVDIVDDLSSGSTENLSGFKLREIHAGMASLDRPVPDDVINFYVGDFTSDAVLEKIAAKKYDVVFHLAAVPRVSYSVEFPTLTTEANLMKSVALFEVAAKSGTRVVASSSSSVYGGADVMPTPESEPRDPKSPYALQKSVMEDFGRLFSSLYGFDVVFLRYFNVFGPNQRDGSAYATAITAWCSAIKNGKSLRSDGDGSQTRDMCYVDNVVSANYLAGIREEKFTGQAYNVCCGDSVSNAEILDHLRTRFSGIDIKNAPWRPGDVMHTLGDWSAAKRDLGYEPLVRFWDGLNRTIAWWELE
jgi:nucleoside-diphosphate-sugar epimerase